MFSLVARRGAATAAWRSAAATRASVVPASATRFLSDMIPSDTDRPVGRRGAEVMGLVYNESAITPPLGAGTKEKPIEVPSELDCRVVGYEDPELHALYWFRLKENKLYYVQEIDKYFKLVKA